MDILVTLTAAIIMGLAGYGVTAAMFRLFAPKPALTVTGESITNQALLGTMVLRPGYHVVIDGKDTLEVVTKRHGDPWPEEFQKP